MPGTSTECQEYALHFKQLGEAAATPEAVTLLGVTGQSEFEVKVSGDLIIVREPATLFYAVESGK